MGVAFLLIFGSGTCFANQAGLVIKHGDGQVITRGVSFNESSISGAELIRRSGLQNLIITTGWGEEVRQINNEGNPDNLGAYVGGKWVYWVYYHLQGNSWQKSGVGAGNYRVRNGDVEGWVWGTSNSTPPVITFSQICPPKPSPSGSNKNSSQPSNTGSASKPKSVSASAPPGSNNAETADSQTAEAEENSDAPKTKDAEDKSSDKNSSGEKGKKGKKDKKSSYWNSLFKGENPWFNYGAFLIIILGLLSMVAFYAYTGKRNHSVK